MTRARFILGMTVTLTAAVIGYSLLLRYVLHVSAGATIALMLPVVVCISVSAVIGYKTWDTRRLQATSPRSSLGDRRTVMRPLAYLVPLAVAVWTSIALWWQGFHRIAALCLILVAVLGMRTIQVLTKKPG